VALAPAASVTVTVTSKVPLAVGTPQSSPSPAPSLDHQSRPADTTSLWEPVPLRIDIPAGSPVAVHVKGAVPPLTAAIPRLQTAPTVQSWRFPTP
jgi:hypothetical protein